ncbi:hypothetical protein M422DRAFT_275489 [Sphaerobolus stellatus SS14]|uniref:Uncharacterized protein n=1 Tax=Sphaerobolus stellatus (strain SS14) TaxID=990650 RepID=A0A0C9UEG5_SPHS4|nr:hypothetical protein M422DRAFT_275489 [Sphaerobolus stellatus SS14]
MNIHYQDDMEYYLKYLNKGLLTEDRHVIAIICTWNDHFYPDIDSTTTYATGPTLEKENEDTLNDIGVEHQEEHSDTDEDHSSKPNSAVSTCENTPATHSTQEINPAQNFSSPSSSSSSSSSSTESDPPSQNEGPKTRSMHVKSLKQKGKSHNKTGASKKQGLDDDED